MESVNYNNRDIKIYTILLTILLLVKPLNQIIIAYFPSMSGTIMTALYLVLDLGLIVITIAKRKVLIIRYNFIAAVALFILYLLSKYLFHTTEDNVLYMITYVFVPLLFCWNMDIDYNLFFRICVIIPLFGLPVLGKMFTLKYGTIEMGTSYAFLLVSIVPVFYLFKIKEKSRLLVLASIFDLVYTAQVFLYGARGSVLSIAVSVIAIAFTSYSNRIGLKKNGTKSLLLIGLILLLIFYYRQLFTIGSSLLESLGISPYFLQKTVRLEGNVGALNGRDTIYAISLDLIKKRPILGYGFDSFDYYTGLRYPHNFILQFIHDFGIIGASLLIFPLLRGIVKHINRCSYSEYIVFMILFVSTIPGALFSGNVWNNMAFWTIASYLFRKGKQSLD